MKRKYDILRVKYTLLLLFLSFSLNAQEHLWSEASKKEIPSIGKSADYTVYKLNKRHFLKKLEHSPFERKTDTITFPIENGKEQAFVVWKNEVFSPKLQAKFPRLSSYVGKSIKGNTTVYFSTSPYGVNAVFYENGKRPVYIDPKGENYVKYRATTKGKPSFKCEVRGSKTTPLANQTNLRKRVNNDNQLRTFRLALAVTGEYSQYHLNLQGIPNSASEQEKKEVVLTALQNAVTRINSIYERDLSIHLKLVDNNDLLIFLDPNTDDFINGDPVNIINKSKTLFDDTIGYDNYDIGHTFSTGAGGLAWLGGACTNDKHQGVTGMPNPTGDSFHIDYVCHEIGHQFGATHTFNGNAGDCSSTNKNFPTAYEPGSGSTIMGYAGICAPENVQVHSDAYFHYISIQQIERYVAKLSCPTKTEIDNTAPEITPLKGYIVPVSTPFALTAKATDKEDHNLTYTWEQLDNEIVAVPLESTNTGGPAFRSILPTSDATRYFPNVNTVLSNQLENRWEVLPSVTRDMHFAVTVRDNHVGGGRTTSERMTLSFTDKASAFEVTSQSREEIWQGGSEQTITWKVAHTDKDPVNCKKVSVLFSDDGGMTFSHTLAEGIFNNGKATVFAPNIDTDKGRIKVKSEGNVFYAVNKAEINVQKSATPQKPKFLVEVKDQTCPTQQDGAITIIANQDANYTTTIGGQNYTFTRSLLVENMKGNTYNFCVSADGVQQKCFEKTMLKGNILKVKKALDYPKCHITITEGTAPYKVFVNEKELLTTSESNFEVEVKNGDFVKVETSVPCEGIYETEIIQFKEIRAFPNPTSGKFEISVPQTKLTKVNVTLIDITGNVISYQKHNVFAKRLSLDISHLPNGIYIAIIATEKKKSIKIIKQ